MKTRFNGFVLLALGLAAGWFATAGEYTMLMNASFRWVTITGSCLLVIMGAVLTWSPQRVSVSALVTFGLFIAMVAVARPHEGGVAPHLAPPANMPALNRAGYAPLRLQDLFTSIDVEATDIEERPAAVSGFVKRLPGLDAKGEFILLAPLMTCCLADAVAFGIRVKTPDGALPEEGDWVHAFGDIRNLAEPVVTPPFRVGAILFTPVTRVHELVAQEVLSAQSMLEDLYDKLPEDFCSEFRRLVAASDLLETLRAEGPFTVLAPHDAAFERMSADDRDALATDAQRRDEFLSDLIVPGRIRAADLRDMPALTAISGKRLPIQVANGRIRINNARILLADVEARNGVLHLMNPAPTSVSARK